MQIIKIIKCIGVYLTISCLILVLIAGLPIKDNDSYVTATDQPLMRIVFDNTHEETKSITGEYKNVAGLLDNKGYLVNKSTEIHTDLSIVLLNCNVFVVTTPHVVFRPNETQLIENFVAEGGNLFLLGGYEFNSTLTASINSLSTQFGIQFDQKLVEDPNDNNGRPYQPIIRHFSAHPIINTTDIKEIVLYNATTLSGGTSVARTGLDADPSNASVLAVSKYGKGKIAAISDSDLFSNTNINENTRGLILNIFGWFVFEVNQVFVKAATVAQGDFMDVILELETIRNYSNLFIRVVGEGLETFEGRFNLTAGMNRISIEVQISVDPYTFGDRTISVLIIYKPQAFNRNILYKTEFPITIRIPLANLIIGYGVPLILIFALFLYSYRSRNKK
ncbi:MAG: DUF4350 domain-containing protein [Promethearchaeota archaeon]